MDSPTNFHNVVANIPVPTTLDQVPGALYAILDAWAEFGLVLEQQMNEAPRNPVAALGAATAGGALGVLKMVVRPTIENMAQAIEANLNTAAEIEAAAWADNDAQAVDLTDLDPEVESIDAWAERTGYAALHTERTGYAALHTDTDPTPAAGMTRGWSGPPTTPEQAAAMGVEWVDEVTS